jgi:hypothetical protein
MTTVEWFNEGPIAISEFKAHASLCSISCRTGEAELLRLMLVTADVATPELGDSSTLANR